MRSEPYQTLPLSVIDIVCEIVSFLDPHEILPTALTCQIFLEATHRQFGSNMSSRAKFFVSSIQLVEWAWKTQRCEVSRLCLNAAMLGHIHTLQWLWDEIKDGN